MAESASAADNPILFWTHRIFRHFLLCSLAVMGPALRKCSLGRIVFGFSTQDCQRHELFPSKRLGTPLLDVKRTLGGVIGVSSLGIWGTGLSDIYIVMRHVVDTQDVEI